MFREKKDYFLAILGISRVFTLKLSRMTKELGETRLIHMYLCSMSLLKDVDQGCLRDSVAGILSVVNSDLLQTKQKAQSHRLRLK